MTENTTPVSTQALLLVPKNIESNAELDYKAQNPNKLNHSWIPKKPKTAGGTDKHCTQCKKHGGPFKDHNTFNLNFNNDGT